jgi:hypothetical protein
MAEAELNALKKLEANKSCANCDAYNKFGHGNVCEKFRTFVCSNCKSAHQSFSHRVKSVTMSNWSQDDVDALRDDHGGGNAAAKRVWLAHWDEKRLRKPQEGDHVDVYKRFIDKVYNDRTFYDEDGATTPSSSTSTSSSSTSSGRRVNGSSSSRRAAAASASSSAGAFLLIIPMDTFMTLTVDAGGASVQLRICSTLARPSRLLPRRLRHRLTRLRRRQSRTEAAARPRLRQTRGARLPVRPRHRLHHRPMRSAPSHRRRRRRRRPLHSRRRLMRSARPQLHHTHPPHL